MKVARCQGDADPQRGGTGLVFREARRLVHAINADFLCRIGAGASDLLPAGSRPEEWRELNVQARERLASFQLLLIRAPMLISEYNAAASTEAIVLARCTFTATWSLAHWGAQGLLLFGIAPSEASSITSIPVTELDQLAVKCAASIRPRWEGDTEFWDALLEAAIRGDIRLWHDVQMHAWQRLGSELLDLRRIVQGPVAWSTSLNRSGLPG